MEESMNLLKLCGITKSNEYNIEIDYYVPFSVEYGDCFNLIKEYIVYWRTGDIERSLMEFGLGSNTGVLRKITLTAVKNAVLSDAIINYKMVEEGTPVFDGSMIPQKGISDFINDFQVLLGENRITCIIGQVDKCEKIVRTGRVDIGVDCGSYITHISINDLTIDEYKELKESLKL